MRDAVWIVLSLSLSGSLLFGVTLGISRLFKNRFAKGWHYYVWLLVLLRFLVPAAPQANLAGAVFQAIPPPRSEVAAQQTPAPRAADAQESAAQAPEGSGQVLTLGALVSAVGPWLWVLWLGVALGLAIRKITLYQSFATYIRAGNTEVSDPAVLNRLAEACEALGIRRQIGLYENPLAASPLMLGIFRPAIVLPSTALSDVEFHCIALHELTHYRRGDIYYKWLVQAVLCLHWFNPLTRVLSREIGAACELSCDEAVLRRLDGGAHRAYGQVLVDSLEGPGKYRQALAGITLSEHAQTMKERLQAIMKYQKKHSRTVWASLALAALLAVGGLAMGAVTPAAVAARAAAPAIILEGKPEAYRLVAQLLEVDTAQSVADYAGAVQAICEAAGTDLFAVLADSGIDGSDDPLYAFSTGTLARTSSELYAEVFSETERPMVFGYAQWERYATAEEKEAALRGFSAEERQAFEEATADEPEYPVAMLYAYYTVYYDILDGQALSVQERDERLDAVLADMQAYVEGLTEAEVFGDGFEAGFAAALTRAAAQHATGGMTIEGEFGAAEGYRDGEPMF